MTDADRLVAALRERGWTVAVAESLTGGAVASEIVTVPGASGTFLGAVVAYATPIKHSLLGVDAMLLAERGPVDPQVALQMAEGIRRVVSVDGRPADVGISTTGIAGPTSPDGQPVGTVHIGIVTPAAEVSRSHQFAGSRDEVRAQARDAAITAALQALRE